MSEHEQTSPTVADTVAAAEVPTPNADAAAAEVPMPNADAAKGGGSECAMAGSSAAGTAASADDRAASSKAPACPVPIRHPEGRSHRNHFAPPTRKKQERRIITARELLKLILPIAAIFIAYGLTLSAPNIYPVGYEMEYYPLFLMVMLAVYVVFLVLAVFLPPVRQKMLGWSYLIAAMFLLIELLDLLTVKSGILLLPFAPSPDRILQALPNNLEAYGTNLAASMVLLAEGVVIGLVTGFATGLLMGWSRIANYWFAPLLKIIGPVPSAAWLPIAVVLMPTAHLAGVFLISIAIWFPLSLMLSSAIRSTDKRKIEAARTMGASEGYILFHVALPAAVPDIFTALFMGLSSSFGALIISEQLGVKAGLGWYINWASSWGEYYKVFASVGIFIIIFYILINLLFKIRDHVMKWQESVVRW